VACYSTLSWSPVTSSVAWSNLAVEEAGAHRACKRHHFFSLSLVFCRRAHRNTSPGSRAHPSAQKGADDGGGDGGGNGGDDDDGGDDEDAVACGGGGGCAERRLRPNCRGQAAATAGATAIATVTILMVLVELVVDTVVVMTMLLGAGVIAGGAEVATTIAAV
jgi:hypothetical protein